jgi:hypothetical protein
VIGKGDEKMMKMQMKRKKRRKRRRMGSERVSICLVERI